MMMMTTHADEQASSNTSQHQCRFHAGARGRGGGTGPCKPWLGPRSLAGPQTVAKFRRILLTLWSVSGVSVW